MIEAAGRSIRPRPGSAARLVPVVATLAAAVTIAVGQWIKATGGQLGAFFPPFYIWWAPHVGPLAPVAASILIIGAAAAPAWLRWARRPVVFAGGLYVLALGIGVSVNTARGGVDDLWAVFNTGRGGLPEASHEYLPGYPALARGIHFYVSHFAQLLPSLPIHAEGNPPGPLIALHLLGIDTPQGLAALCIGVGALSAPLVYDLGRTLGGEERGRIAGALTVFSPGLVIWGVTSADYAFATLGLAAACLLVRRQPAARAAGAVVAAAVTFFSWLLFAVPAWAVAVVLQREGPRRAVALTALCGVAFAAVYGGLALALGYDPIATLTATVAAYHRTQHHRPYAFWLFGSPTAWWISLGLPIGWLALRAATKRDASALALASVVIVSAVLGFTNAETERIWLPYTPLACLAAAAALRPQRLRPVLCLMAAQTLAAELLFHTIW